MYFPQEHPPGREAQIDFIHCGELKVTVAGQPYQHLLFQLIPSHSGWRYAEVAAGETFLARCKRGCRMASGPWAASHRWCIPTIRRLPHPRGETQPRSRPPVASPKDVAETLAPGNRSN